MKPFRWGHEKNEQLKAERNISFEEIVLAIEADGLLDIVVHSNLDKYPRQRMFVVEVERYVYLVPFVEEADHYFLKTVIPNRKATRDYLKGGV
ncbi:MAG: toxin [Nitrospira sp.]